MVFCISTQFFHPHWDADVDYDAIVLPSRTVVLLITTPYDTYEPARIFKLSTENYDFLASQPDGPFDITPQQILKVAFNEDYPKNIVNDTCKNRGEYIHAGQSYYEQNPLRKLILYTMSQLVAEDRNYLMNWLSSNLL